MICNYNFLFLQLSKSKDQIFFTALLLRDKSFKLSFDLGEILSLVGNLVGNFRGGVL